ncbi:hypothetical protein [Sporosarcina sp. 6E9]|nr:hypothetical protein [Sporosarcina sp. 6E9]
MLVHDLLAHGPRLLAQAGILLALNAICLQVVTFDAQKMQD